ncbi:MAG: TrmH family RNA methyltransferase [Acidimicrobiia bacterium]
MAKISSSTNPRVKALVRLRSRRERDRSGRFLIEGHRELSRAVEAGQPIEEVYFAPDLFREVDESLLLERTEAQGARLFELTEAPFRKVSYRGRPDGLLAVAPQFQTGLARLAPGTNPLLLAVEAIEKPGNLGTMLRTADAVGADSVIVCDPTTDLFNPNVVRASLGALFTVPVAVVTTNEALSWLRSADVKTYAATPTAELAYYDADYSGPSAVVVGSEQLGLSDDWLAGSTARLRIPMSGRIDSLNSAMAAGILLFEAARQRAES